MRADKMNSWLSLAANIGVVIGLILLTIEIGQNTEMMRAQINQSRTRGEQLSDEGLIRYERFFRAFNRNQDNNLWQFSHGYLGENTLHSIRGAVREVIAGHELGIATWELQKYSYTAEYVAFVDDAIADLR